MSLLITPPFRISFPSLVVATGYQDGPKKFGVTALWLADDVKGKHKDSWGPLVKALDAKAREFFDTPLSRLPANVRRGIRNGNEKAHLNGYGDGVLFAALSTDRKPQVVDLSRELIPDDRISTMCYPGAWCRASVNVYAYDNIGKGVALGLNNIQWLGHGDRLDSVTDAKTDFESDPDDIWFERAAEADPDATADSSAAGTADSATSSDPDDFDDDIPF